MKVNFEDIINDVDLSIFDTEKILDEFDYEREYAACDYDEEMDYYHNIEDPYGEYDGWSEDEPLFDCFLPSMHITDIPETLYI